MEHSGDEEVSLTAEYRKTGKNQTENDSAGENSPHWRGQIFFQQRSNSVDTFDDQHPDYGTEYPAQKIKWYCIEFPLRINDP